jgi:hypothetical protein
VRGNGLSADAYVAVADLDPGTADALLAALRDRGVAAYAAASPEPVPEGDTDRLYVDVAAVEQARALITVELSAGDGEDDFDVVARERPDGLGPDLLDGDLLDGDMLDRDVHDSGGRDGRDDELAGVDLDAEFAAIVAGFHTAAPGTHPWPDAEDVPTNRRRTDPGFQAADQADPGTTVSGAEVLESGTGSRGDSGIGWEDLLRPVPAPEPEPEPGYVPPPPPPLPHASLGTRIAWAAVLGGPALLFLAVLLGWHLADWVMLVAAVSFLGGFVALVARLGEGPDDPDDDGAVV